MFVLSNVQMIRDDTWFVVQCISAVGGLPWLAGQTRPDLAAMVAFSQKRQGSPQVEDLELASKAVREARDHHGGCRWDHIDSIAVAP